MLPVFRAPAPASSTRRRHRLGTRARARRAHRHALPHEERRARLERVSFPRDVALVADRFDDGAALWDVVPERGLEGVVAKRLGSRYLPGERGWVKTKNRETWWRYEFERDGAIEARR